MRTRLIGVIATIALAALGSIVLIVYVRNAEDRAMAGVRTMDVLVVSETVPEGTAAGDLDDLVEVEAVPAKVVASGAVSSLDELDGLVTTAELQAGEQVIASRFADPDELAEQGRVEIPEGMQQVTVALDAERVIGGQLAAGDTVGFFASFTDGSSGGDDDDDDDGGGGGGGATTHQVLHKVLVTAVQYDGGDAAAPSEAEGEDGEESGSSSAPAPPGGSVLVTFAVDAGDAERIVFAAEHGTVWLSAEPEGASESGTRVQNKETIYE